MGYYQLKGDAFQNLIGLIPGADIGQQIGAALSRLIPEKPIPLGKIFGAYGAVGQKLLAKRPDIAQLVQQFPEALPLEQGGVDVSQMDDSGEQPFDEEMSDEEYDASTEF